MPNFALAAAQVGRLRAVALRNCSLRLERVHDLPDFRGWTGTRQLDISGLESVIDRQLEVRSVG